MDKCTYTLPLPEKLLRKLSTVGNKMDEISEHVLKVGREVVLEKVKSNLSSVLSGESTGEEERSLGLSGVRVDKNDNASIKIGFAEPRSDGKRRNDI